ncbi:MAG: aminopeptidase [Desulfovibrionaceae bacterium]|nr:aminopeptidase [Desulfovibrionaceae bacterium]MBF0513339.1 aminopeptidase [Desulfovibrionaceae bacterium]
MFTQKQIDRYASVLMWGLRTARPGGYKKHDIVLIQCDPPGLKLMEAVYDRVVEAGLHAVPRVNLTSPMELAFFRKADAQQLVFQPPGAEELYSRLHGAIYILAPESLTHLSEVDPKRIATVAVARKPLRDILTRREEQGKFGWTLCLYPTDEPARLSGLSKREYARQIAEACFLNDAAPETAWEDIFRSASEIKRWLSEMDAVEYHVESASVDLRVSRGDKRRFLGISGHNIPSFEIFTSPDWRGVSGVFFADQPSYRSGNYVRGVKLEFAAGRVTASDAAEGAEFLRKQLAMDKGSDKVGEFSLTDKRFSRISAFMANTLYDENHGGEYGNCHIAIGSSYSDTYSGDPSELTKESKAALGFNDSALHWDLVNTEPKRVSAKLRSGEKIAIYENGVFLY